MGSRDVGGSARYWMLTVAVSCCSLISACDGAPAVSRGSTAGEQISALMLEGQSHESVVLFPNRFGFSRTLNAAGGAVTQPTSPFFQSLGTNGRSAAPVTCPRVG